MSIVKSIVWGTNLTLADRATLACVLLLAGLVCSCASKSGRSTSDPGTGSISIPDSARTGTATTHTTSADTAGTDTTSAGGTTRVDLSGVLLLPSPPRTRGSGVDTVRGSASSSTGGATEAVIYLVPDHPEDTKPPNAQDMVTQTAAGFEPRILPVVVGTKVKFRNQDRIYHSPFSVSPARSFDLEPQGPGESHSVTFDKVGVVNVYCELHSTETCFVIVVPDERFTRPNSRGEFSFPLLAAGDYTVTAWHPIHGETARKVNLSEPGELNLTLSY